MTKQNTVSPEAVAITIPVPRPTSTPTLPPLCSGGGAPAAATRAKLLAQVVDRRPGRRRIAGLVESMRASSPTRSAKAAAALAAAAYIGFKEEMDEWVERHPSALEVFDEMLERTKGKQVVMFLDYDGTLSPIVDDPDRAFMSDAMREAVRNIGTFFPTAIVSGRCRNKVFEFVRLPELFYAGSHGLDIKGPHAKGTSPAEAKAVLYQPASHFLPMIDKVYKALVEGTKSIPGARVENNKFCVSVHFRRVEEKRWSSLAEQVRLVMMEYPRLRLSHGRKVLEIRPAIKWDKGKALEFLLESLGFSNCDRVLPIYIGDDRTDEDAFKVLRDRGQGFGILVSKLPRETSASYSLRDTVEVMDFLGRLVEYCRKREGERDTFSL